jgi:hypothetical protein
MMSATFSWDARDILEWGEWGEERTKGFQPGTAARRVAFAKPSRLWRLQMQIQRLTETDGDRRRETTCSASLETISPIAKSQKLANQRFFGPRFYSIFYGISLEL